MKFVLGDEFTDEATSAWLVATGQLIEVLKVKLNSQWSLPVTPTPPPTAHPAQDLEKTPISLSYFNPSY